MKTFLILSGAAMVLMAWFLYSEREGWADRLPSPPRYEPPPPSPPLPFRPPPPFPVIERATVERRLPRRGYSAEAIEEMRRANDIAERQLHLQRLQLLLPLPSIQDWQRDWQQQEIVDELRRMRFNQELRGY